MPLPPLGHLEGQGDGTLGSGGVDDRISHPFPSPPPLSRVPRPLPSYSRDSVKEMALHGEVLSPIKKGTVELAPPSPDYYSHLFVVWKAMG